MIISIFNQAGGVAKTTLTMNLGYALGQLKQKVLLIDFDPQASLTIFMGLDPWSLDATVYHCIMKDADPQPAIHHIHDIDLLPANRILGLAEAELVLADVREKRLINVLNGHLQPVDPKHSSCRIREYYDFILIDCPPSLGMLSYLALVSSDSVLIPIETEFKAYQGTDLLFETIARVRKGANPDLGIAGFVPTKYSKNKSQHKRVLAAIQEQLPEYAPVFTPIPNATAFTDASENRVPLALYESNHPALAAINKLAKAIKSSQHRNKGKLARA
jgi:chromosome partitioning protein